MIKFTIPGEPVGKGRPRMNTITGTTYTPSKTKQYEQWVKKCYLEQCGQGVTGKVKANIKAYYKIPKSESKKTRQSMLDGHIRPTKTPDADNIAKSVLDALNKVAYKDDSCVVELIVEKWYSENPRVEVYIDNASNP